MDKKLVGLISVFFLSFVLFITMVAFNANPLQNNLRAKEEAKPDGTSSLLLAFPLTIKADGKTASSISVFVRTTQGKPVAAKLVNFTSSVGNLSTPSLTTDNDGKGTTTLTCSSPGVAEIQATIENTIPLAQKLSIKCE